ncbi:MAG: DNA glycosylase [Candidatus Thorarchaeota archaeon]
MKKLEVSDFSLQETLECGQTFCWVKEGNGYINADIGRVVYVEQQGNLLLYETSHGDVSLEHLFRLEDPLENIQKEISKDELMRKSIQFAPGLRIIQDPFYPCLISFLISTRNNIPTIKRATQAIREKYGPSYEFRGKTYRGMPSPTCMSLVTVSELEALKLAWRAKFIVRSTEALLAGEVDPKALIKMSYEQAHYALKTLHGVGDKVADCVCLFSLGFLEAFPIDVWIERIIQQQYGIFTSAGKSYAKKGQAARDYFGQYAGYAQEYLYYHTRTTQQSRG